MLSSDQVVTRLYLGFVECRMVAVGGSSTKSVKLNNLVQVLNKAEKSTLTIQA